MKIMFLHGLESGPHGSKYQALAAVFDVMAPDFQGMADITDIEKRFEHLEALTRGQSDLLLVGSSFGGLLAALMAHRHPERVAGYVLCAPALHRPEAAEIVHVPPQVAILHGRADSIVPLEASEAFAKKHGLALTTVTDDHRLQASLARVVSLTGQIKEAIIRSQ